MMQYADIDATKGGASELQSPLKARDQAFITIYGFGG
jgi:hypothetical protein